MSLVISDLTKKYGHQIAVKDVSFAVGPGEIVGFLGPNGSGKSTTMKIITGYISPSRGHVEVAGHNVEECPLEAKKHIGYLPENNPLYLDMYVKEYLYFMGSLHGLVGNVLRTRVNDLIDVCGLTDNQGKVLGVLSKGYRQRVGIVQALLHNPRVLILDEPTSGLDPNQVVEIRRVISDVGRDKAVLFSTHVMQEVESMCDRIIVINKGMILADDTFDEFLRRHTHTQALTIRFRDPFPEEDLMHIEGVEKILKVDETTFKLFSRLKEDLQEATFRYVAQCSGVLVEMKKEEGDMEEIFKNLTT